MGKYDGKTLLILGSNVGASEIVKYAQENGAHTIVTDYYNKERSLAKRYADECFMISTDDDEGLSSIVKERNVDGILAGVSEFNLLQAMKLSERHGLPFYCTRKQWDTIESKDGFRQLCEKFDVPCPKTFFVGQNENEIPWNEIKYPAIIKPVDANSSRGVHICKTQNDIEYYFNDALSNSTNKRVIIEEFSRGDEFTAHYTICNGNAALACMDNRHPVAVHEGDVTTVPIARIYPSTFLNEYLEKVNPQMVSLCEGIGIKDAVLFIQGLYDDVGETFSVFEAGLRSAGETPCRFLKDINGVDYFQLLVDHALSVKTDYQQEHEDPSLGGAVAAIYSFVAKGAEVGSIVGLEDTVEKLKSVKSTECRYKVGSITPDSDTLRQLMIRFVMECDSREQLSNEISYLNNNIFVKDTNEEEMVIKMDPSRVFEFIN